MQGKFFLFGAFALAGTSVVAAKYVSEKLGAFTIVAMSLLFALALLLPLCGGRLRRAIRDMPKRARIAAFFQAFFGVFLFRVLFINGIGRTSSAEAGILTGATPAVTACLAWAILRETANGRMRAGVFVTDIGVLLVEGLGA